MNIAAEDLKFFLEKQISFLDVRAPVEFAQGSLFGAVNIPLLENSEREKIGTVYKSEGREAAIELGLNLVNGEVRESRLSQWKEFFSQNPEAIIYCFRGGLRSQTVQKWLSEIGIHRPILVGGYKAARTFLADFVDQFCAKQDVVILSGPTGSGKTHFLNKVKAFYPVLDLEKIANHKGSAFGADFFTPQPSQANFEVQLATVLIQLNPLLGSQSLLIEDESRMVGKIVLPESLFVRMRSSKIVWIDETIDQRAKNILEDYVVSSIQKARENGRDESFVYGKFEKSIVDISRKLGGARASECLSDLKKAQDGKDIEMHLVWIRKLLNWYYDPLYLGSLDRRKPDVLFKGNQSSCFDFIKSLGEMNKMSMALDVNAKAM